MQMTIEMGQTVEEAVMTKVFATILEFWSIDTGASAVGEVGVSAGLARRQREARGSAAPRGRKDKWEQVHRHGQFSSEQLGEYALEL